MLEKKWRLSWSVYYQTYISFSIRNSLREDLDMLLLIFYEKSWILYLTRALEQFLGDSGWSLIRVIWCVLPSTFYNDGVKFLTRRPWTKNAFYLPSILGGGDGECLSYSDFWPWVSSGQRMTLIHCWEDLTMSILTFLYNLSPCNPAIDSICRME